MRTQEILRKVTQEGFYAPKAGPLCYNGQSTRCSRFMCPAVSTASEHKPC